MECGVRGQEDVERIWAVGWLPFFQASGGGHYCSRKLCPHSFLSIHRVLELTHMTKEKQLVCFQESCDLAVKHIYHYRSCDLAIKHVCHYRLNSKSII